MPVSHLNGSPADPLRILLELEYKLGGPSGDPQGILYNVTPALRSPFSGMCNRDARPDKVVVVVVLAVLLFGILVQIAARLTKSVRDAIYSFYYVHATPHSSVKSPPTHTRVLFIPIPSLPHPSNPVSESRRVFPGSILLQQLKRMQKWTFFFYIIIVLQWNTVFYITLVPANLMQKSV